MDAITYHHRFLGCFVKFGLKTISKVFPDETLHNYKDKKKKDDNITKTESANIWCEMAPTKRKKKERQA